MRPLGSEQRGVLRALAEHKRWYGGGWGCGWNWGTALNTQRILHSLEKRGLVTRAVELTGDKEHMVYRVSEAGTAYLAAAQPEREALGVPTGYAPLRLKGVKP